MRHKILYHNNSLLKQVSRPVTNFQEISEIVDKLKESLRYEDKVWTGTGLSLCGIQIGIPLRVIILARPLFWTHCKFHHGFDIIINPKILKSDSAIVEDWEGCLSYPDIECFVPRPKKIELEYLSFSNISKKKTLDNLAARVLQHEIDHLDGVLMTEKAVDSRKKT